MNRLATVCVVVLLSFGACVASGSDERAGTTGSGQLRDVSRSKLGVHIIDPTAPGVDTILDACPRIVKWVFHERTAESVARYRRHCVGGTVVVRAFVPHSIQFLASQDPVEAADQFWWEQLWPWLATFDRSAVDWVESANELDNIPDWYHSLDNAKWFSVFSARMAELITGAGMKPLLGSVGQGNPSLPPDQNTMAPLADVMLGTVAARGADSIGWAYHSYTTDPHSWDGAESDWVLFRYRRAQSASGLAGTPIVLTEGGINGRELGGWQHPDRHLSADGYMDWLKWYDGELQQDADVIGVTLFTLGGGDQWSLWDLSPIAEPLANYIASQ